MISTGEKQDKRITYHPDPILHKIMSIQVSNPSELLFELPVSKEDDILNNKKELSFKITLLFPRVGAKILLQQKKEEDDILHRFTDDLTLIHQAVGDDKTHGDLFSAFYLLTPPN